jgi:hypothetical protein
LGITSFFLLNKYFNRSNKVTIHIVVPDKRDRVQLVCPKVWKKYGEEKG